MPLPGKKTSAILQSVTVTQNATTGKNEVATATAATFFATFHPVRASEALVFNKDTTTVTHILRVDHSRLGDTIAAALIANHGGGYQIVIDSKTYDITGVVEWDTSPSHHYRVNLRSTDVDN